MIYIYMIYIYMIYIYIIYIYIKISIPEKALITVWICLISKLFSNEVVRKVRLTDWSHQTGAGSTWTFVRYPEVGELKIL